ncbi:MAG: CP12 domain-containing protein [Flammeovirgaceae bacterium]
MEDRKNHHHYYPNDHHPEDLHDPTPLELYCDAHPDALECRVYDD